MTELEKARANLDEAIRLSDEAHSAYREGARLLAENQGVARDEAEVKCHIAQKAFNEALVASSTHPWLGKKVRRVVRRDISPKGSWRSVMATIEDIGVVEICGPDTRFVSRASAPIGQPVVRLILKSGKPGAKCARLNIPRWNYGDEAVDGWALVE